MAKAVITITDDGDAVNVCAAFDPELVMAEDATPAQLIAFRVMEKMSREPDAIKEPA